MLHDQTTRLYQQRGWGSHLQVLQSKQVLQLLHEVHVLPHAPRSSVYCSSFNGRRRRSEQPNIAYAASENRLQIKGASGKARQRKGNSLLLENKLQQGPGHRRYEKFVLHEKRNDLVLSGEPNKYKTNNETMSSAHITPRFGITRGPSCKLQEHQQRRQQHIFSILS